MKKSDYEREVEKVLKEYGRDESEKWAAEMDKYLAEDENAEANFAKSGKRRYVKPRRRTLRYAAIFIAAVFIGSVVIPVPQASAWRVWWLDLVFGENEEDVDIVSNNEDQFIEYYVSKIPKGFEVSQEKNDGQRYFTTYVNEEKEYITFSQTKKGEQSLHLDNQSRSGQTEVIDDFEVLISTGEKNIIFEIMTDNVAISITTNAGYDVGKEFICSLEKL